MRAKFKLVGVESSVPVSYRRLKFQAVYDPNIPEDVSFNKATPSGEITMQVDNPATFPALILGEDYYVDFTLIPKQPA